MLIDMQTTERVTVTLPKELAERLRQRVSAGEAESVSGYVTSIIEERFEKELLTRWMADMEAVGGKPTEEDYAWADEVVRLARGE
jgi:Arc/MetJ-type ribon-helix-helix transcriptional regulator